MVLFTGIREPYKLNDLVYLMRNQIHKSKCRKLRATGRLVFLFNQQQQQLEKNYQFTIILLETSLRTDELTFLFIFSILWGIYYECISIKFSSKRFNNHTNRFNNHIKNNVKIRSAYFYFEVCLGAEVAINPVTIDSTFLVHINLLVIENFDILENKKVNHTHEKHFSGNCC